MAHSGITAAGLLLAALASPAFASKPPPVSEQLQDPKAANVAILSHVLEPEQLAPDTVLPRIKLPEGFSISVFAKDLINPRIMAVAKSGDVYVTRRQVGDVVLLRDGDGDGVAEVQKTVARRPGMHGIAIAGDTVYLATVKEVYKAFMQEDGSLGPLFLLADDLPDGGQHPNRTLAVGPDGYLYISVGSTCNACSETNPEHATILQMAPDGSSRTIFASGLRNTVGFGFEPETQVMWGMDHGIDWLGDNEQHEELNEIVKGNQYGWPYIYADSRFNPQDEPPGDISLEEWAARSVEPAGFYVPHAAPMQMIFHSGKSLPSDYAGDAFVAMRGSWNRNPPAGYELTRIRFQGGRPVEFKAFASGFLQWNGGDWGHMGRLVGVAEAKDGSILLSDDVNGVIYRIAYLGDKAPARAAWQLQTGEPTNAWGANVRVEDQGSPQVRTENDMPLASEQLAAPASLTVSSPAFEPGAALPPQYAAPPVGQNVSPPLRWSAGPEGTASYVIIMEDPDAADAPFVHWLIYNIPGSVTELAEGIPPEPQVPYPPDALQGQNDRRSIGYFGPLPPPEDPAHRYVFQVFALDTRLNLLFGASRDELLQAMEGHVLASGSVTGTFDR